MAGIESSAEYAQNLDTAHARLAELTDPVGLALARKAILQTGVLDYAPDVVDFGPEGPVDLGIFRVLPTEAIVDWASPSGKFAVTRGQKYLDFHLPRSDVITVETANQGYAEIAQYMRLHPELTHIMGVTYRVMALSAERNQQFNIEKIQLPEEVMSYATAFWQNMNPTAQERRFLTAHMVWLDRATFIDRFDGAAS